MSLTPLLLTLFSIGVLGAYAWWLGGSIRRHTRPGGLQTALIGASLLSIVGAIAVMLGGCYLVSSHACRPRLTTYAITHMLRTDLDGGATDAVLGGSLGIRGTSATLLGGAGALVDVYTHDQISTGTLSGGPLTLSLSDKTPISFLWLLGLARP